MRNVLKMLIGVVFLFVVINNILVARGQAHNQPVVGISAIGVEHNWDINAYNGTIDKVKEMGGRVLSFDGERRVEKQLSDVKTLISNKVDALIVILGDAPSLTPALKEARDAGIPVVTADFDNPYTLSNVSTNNEVAMAELVEYMVEDMGKRGEVGVFFTPGIPVADLRKKVFDSVLAKYSDVHVVAEQPWKIPGTVPDAYEKTQDMLRANPEIDAFWTVFDMPMIGAAQAIADMNDPGIQAKCYGFDGDPTAMKMLQDPNSAYGATVAQQPYLIGQRAAEVAFKILNGETVPRNVYVDHVLVTRDNVQKVLETLHQYKK